MLRADFRNQVPHQSRHFPAQGQLAVLRGKHHVQVDLEYRVRAASTVSHPLRLSSGALAKAVEGEGSNPPRLGQRARRIERHKCMREQF